RDRLPDVTHLAARQREFVLGDREHAVRLVAGFAGDDSDDTGERARLGNVEPQDVTVRVRTAKDAPDIRVGSEEVGGVTRAAGDFLDSIDQRDALSGAFVFERVHVRVTPFGGAHAACTDSTIFTKPVQRQRLPASAARISATEGEAFLRSSPSAAMIIPGVQYPHCAPSFS